MKKWFLFLAAVLVAGGLTAADEPAESGAGRQRGGQEGRRGPGGQNRRGGNMSNMMMGRANAESSVREKFSAEYDAILKEMVAAEEKMAALAKKAEVELPADINADLRKIRTKFPAEFAEAEKAMKEDFRSGMEKMRQLGEKAEVKFSFGGMRGPRGGREAASENDAPPRENPAATVRKLEKLYPQEMKRYRALREEGKQREARQLLRELAEKARKAESRDRK